MDDQRVLNEFQKVKEYLMMRDPTYYFLVMSFPIGYSKDVPKNAYAMFTGNTILVGDRFFSQSLSTEHRAAILMHEVLHAYLGHLERAKDLMKMGKIEEAYSFNVAADVVINERLEASGFEVPWDMLRAGHVGVSRVAALKMSAEELASKLSQLSRRQLFRLYKQSSRLAEGDKEVSDYRLINQGSEEVRRAKDAGSVRRALERGIRRLQTYKDPGTSPGGQLRIVGQLERPTLDWRKLLKAELEEALANLRDVRKRWSRPSRKSEWYPSKIGLGSNPVDVYILIDTSASIDDEKLRRFMSEVYGVLRAGATKITLIPWDVRAYEPIELKREADVEKVRRGLRGGGGTIPDEALRYVLSKARRKSVVIVLSDFELAETGETKRLFRELASRHKTILVSAGKMSVDYPGIFIRLAD